MGRGSDMRQIPNIAGVLLLGFFAGVPAGLYRREL